MRLLGHKKRVLIVGFIILVALLLVSLSAPVAGQGTDGAPTNLDIILLIDNSRSMSEANPRDPRTPTDPDALRVRAARFLVDYLRADEETLGGNYRVGVVSFGGTVGDFQPLRLLQGDTVRDNIVPEIINYTDFRAPLETALHEFEAKSFGTGNQMAVILFTDGRPQPIDEPLTDQQLLEYFADPELRDTVGAMEAEGVTLFVVAVGAAQLDRTNWTQLIPEEHYIAIDSTTELTDVFHAIVADLTGVTTLMPQVLPAGQETSVEVEPYLEHIVFSFMKSDPTISIVLTAPDGNPLSPTTGGTADAHHEIYSESNPDDGPWTISWQGEGTIQFWVDKRFPTVQVEPIEAPHLLGEPFRVMASLLQNRVPVIDSHLHLEARVDTPEEEEVILPLSGRGDGTYVATYEDVQEEGVYTVTVQAILDGQLLKEVRANPVSVSVSAVPSIARFELLGEEHVISQMFALQVVVRHFDRLPDGVVLEVAVTGPMTDTIVLHDDGRSPDGQLGDRIFTGESSVIEMPGQYAFDLSTSGRTKEGLPFSLAGHESARFVSSLAVPSLKQFEVLGEERVVSQTVVLRAVVERSDLLPDGIELEVAMTGPMTDTFVLFDGVAGDGIFTGTGSVITTPGVYAFDLYASDQTEEGLFFNLAGHTEETFVSSPLGGFTIWGYQMPTKLLYLGLVLVLLGAAVGTAPWVVRRIRRSDTEKACQDALDTLRKTAQWDSGSTRSLINALKIAAKPDSLGTRLVLDELSKRLERSFGKRERGEIGFVRGVYESAKSGIPLAQYAFTRAILTLLIEGYANAKMAPPQCSQCPLYPDTESSQPSERWIPHPKCSLCFLYQYLSVLT